MVVFIIASIIIPIVYLVGSERIHEIDDHPIYDVFHTKPYENVTKKLKNTQFAFV